MAMPYRTSRTSRTGRDGSDERSGDDLSEGSAGRQGGRGGRVGRAGWGNDPFAGVMDPDRDPRFLATGRAATAAMTCGQIDLLTSTPPGCRTYQSVNQCDTLAGSRDRLRYLIHGSSGRAVLSDESDKSDESDGAMTCRTGCAVLSDESDGTDGSDGRGA